MFNATMPNLGPLNRPLRFIRNQMPPLNFITLHYLYFIVTSFVSALVFWGSATPFKSIAFTDALFMTMSAMTGAGLNTVNLSQINTFQQIILFVLIMIGNAIFISAIVVHIRLKAFAVKMAKVKKERQRGLSRVRTWASSAVKRRRTTLGDEEAGAGDATEGQGQGQDGGVTNGESEKKDSAGDESSTTEKPVLESIDTSVRSGESTAHDNNALSPNSLLPIASRTQGISFANDVRFGPSAGTGMSRGSTSSQQKRRKPSGLFSFTGVGAQPWVNLRTNVSLDINSPAPLRRAHTNTDVITKAKRDITKYIDDAQGWIARNSQFYGLSEEERDALGGVEYRAVSLLAWVVPAYFVLFQLIAAIGCGGYIAMNKPEVAAEFGVNPWWAGAFNAVSAFNNSGMSLIDANMVPFNRSYYMLMTIGLLVLAGNTW
jgi:hypothetical protein